MTTKKTEAALGKPTLPFKSGTLKMTSTLSGHDMTSGEHVTIETTTETTYDSRGRVTREETVITYKYLTP